MWPINAPIPNVAKSMGSSEIQLLMARIGTKPFAMSPSRVKAAPILLPKRSTLVVPGLSEPDLRGSGKRKSLDTRIALDKEPMRYPVRGNSQ